MDDTQVRRLRVRWAAIGAAVAVSLGAGGLGITRAASSDGERNVFIPITPCRLVDTRPAPATVGSRNTPLAAGETLTVDVHGTNGNCSIPSTATALAANVIAVSPSATGFFTLYPSDVDKPLSSNLNFVAAGAATPNKVDVKLSATGQVSVFNSDGTVQLIIDVFGYYADHDHDDAYQPIGDYVTHGEAVLRYGTGGWYSVGEATPVKNFGSSVNLFAPNATKAFAIDLEAPPTIGGRVYRLTSASYCITSIGAATLMNSASISGKTAATSDLTDRTTAGCFSLVPDEATQAQEQLRLQLVVVGTSGSSSIDVAGVTTTWQPVP